MSAVVDPRFVVRELEGYSVKAGGLAGNSKPGLTVWVADEAYNGRELRVWRSEPYGAMYRETKFEKMRREAAELAASLNA